jgi:MscS family membrane protein
MAGFLVVLFLPAAAHAQTAPDATAQPSAQSAKPETPADPLGRETPRSAVYGFLNAARKDDNAVAAQYLDARQSGAAAETLAHQLFVVLDARLPARLGQINDTPEGSRRNPLALDEEVIGTVERGGGPVPIVLRRLDRPKIGPLWLFSRETLEAVPDLFDEVTATQGDSFLTRAVRGTGLRGGWFEWLSVPLAIAVFYFATLLLNRLLRPVLVWLWRRIFKGSMQLPAHALPVPARLLLVAIVGRWIIATLPLSLLMRQFWSTVARFVAIAAVAWLLILLNGVVEQFIRRRMPRASTSAGSALLRVLRRGADTLVIFLAALATLRLFGIDPTPALAGLGVGGIAIALAAQKTLENVIAGASLVFDQAVRVGDVLKIGDITGEVDHIGLRSTRIRTPDRTIVIIPNSQIANASLETLSARDKFWFRHIVGLRYETTPDQLRTIVADIQRMLADEPFVDAASVRVRFFRLGAFSLDVELFAYVLARDWGHFLEVQEKLLFSVTTLVERAGAQIAFPSQTMYVENKEAPAPVAGSMAGRQ